MSDVREQPAEARNDRDFVVCREEELPPGSMKLVPVGKFGVGVYNVEGTYRAITNYCPHEGAPLCLGRLQGTRVYDADASGGAPGHDGYRYVMDGQVVRCPWHQWEFDLSSGHTLAKPERKIKTYKVRVQDGEVILTR